MLKKLLSISIFLFALNLGFATAYSDLSLRDNVSNADVMPLAIAISHIKQFYVKDPDSQKLFEDAVRGMLEGLDPHSSYLNEKELKALTTQTSGEFVGVGFVVSQDHKTLVVVSPIKGSPAEKAGIKAGDYIIAINNKPTFDMTIDQAVKLIRGKPGTKVELTVVNPKDKKPHRVVVTRKKIDLENISSRMLSDGFGYIQVAQFREHTARDILKAYKKLNKQHKLQGLVLDLRNNPGGLLKEAHAVSDLFLDSRKLPGNKTIVYSKERNDKIGFRLKSKTKDQTNGIPIVVLINGGSASASEIVAGALQDYRRAVVVGTQSFGKGSVQTLLPITNKTAIKLTTALYYTPKGRSIQSTGIKPDIVVEDMTVKSKKDKDEVLAFLTDIREQDLKGHLANGNGKKAAPKKGKAQEILDDYQLSQAENILKAMTLANAQHQ